MPLSKTEREKIAKEYRAFYFETGIYEKRKLGFESCLGFLFSQIENVLEEKINKIEKELSTRHEHGKPCFEMTDAKEHYCKVCLFAERAIKILRK